MCSVLNCVKNTCAQSMITQTVNQRGGAVWETRGTIPGKDGDQAPCCDAGALDPGAGPPPSLHSVPAPVTAGAPTQSTKPTSPCHELGRPSQEGPPWRQERALDSLTPEPDLKTIAPPPRGFLRPVHPTLKAPTAVPAPAGPLPIPQQTGGSSQSLSWNRAWGRGSPGAPGEGEQHTHTHTHTQMRIH